MPFYLYRVVLDEWDGKASARTVSIGPGAVHRFAAVSVKRFEELPHSQVLLDIFRAGDERSYVGVPVILPGRSNRPMLYTSLRLFRDWKTDVKIPPRNQPLQALRTWALRYKVAE